MGATQTKADVLNQVLNQVSIQVITNISNSAQASIAQSNTLNITGSTVSDSNLTLSNLSNVNVSAISSATASGQLQSELSASISQAIAQQASTLGYASNSANVQSIVKNSVNQSITNSTINKAMAEITQSNAANISSSNISGSTIKSENTATALVKLLSDMNTNILAQLQTTGNIQGDLTQKVSNPISDLINGPGLIILIIIGAIAVGFIFFRQQITGIWSQIPSYAKYGMIALLVGLAAYVIYKMTTSKSGSFRGYGYDFEIVPLDYFRYQRNPIY